MISAAASAAWATDKGVVIAAAVVEAIRQAKILLPPIATIERVAIAGRAQTRKRAANALLSSLNADQVSALDDLFNVEPSIGSKRYQQFVREGQASPAYLIERYSDSRRRATLVAFLLDVEERLTDAAIEMTDKLIGSVFTRAKNTQARRYVATSKDVSRLM